MSYIKATFIVTLNQGKYLQSDRFHGINKNTNNKRDYRYEQHLAVSGIHLKVL